MIYRARTMTTVPQKEATVQDVSLRTAAYVNAHYPDMHSDADLVAAL